MISLLKTSLHLRERRHATGFERATKRPDAAQAEVLRALIRQNADTVFGREHRFSTIENPADYARQVPIRDYEGFRPYVDRILAGANRILTAEPPFMFATTSGSTGEPKFIPVTVSWQAELASLTRLWMFYALRDHPACFDQKVLSIVSPAVEGRTPRGIPFGAMSGVVYRRIPWVVRRHYAIPYCVALIRDYETRYFVTMRLALAHHISVIGTPNPTTLIRLAEVASSRGEEIIRAVHDGTLGISTPEIGEAEGCSPAEVFRDIQARIRPDPGRARVLARVVSEHGALQPGYCWPDLRLVACWLGGSAGVHARRLADYYGPHVSLRDLGLFASEGRMTIPIEDRSPAGVLAIQANFYEFVPEERIEDPNPPTLLAHELEEGRRYYIILSGGNGLYRYDINDIVEVEGFYHRTPEVSFVRKGRDMASITGEKLHLNQIQAALRAAETATGLEIWQFRIIPDVERSRYDLLVEFRGKLDPDPRAAAFLERVDGDLRALNPEYAAKRASRRLFPPRLLAMRPRWSERQCREDLRRGKREAQYKWQPIREDWDEMSAAEVAWSLDLPDGRA